MARGFALVGIAIALVVVAIVSLALYKYMATTEESMKAVGGPRLGNAKLTADLSTLAAIRTQLDLYRATNDRLPASREALAGILSPPPRFQCPGNDFTYDPRSGAVGLLIAEPDRC